MSKANTLRPHPRLYAGDEHFERAHRPPELPVLRHAQAAVERAADEFARTPKFGWEPVGHNAHLRRARTMQGRVVTLALRFKQTGKAKYRDAVVAHIREMGSWQYWSWITWRGNDPSPTAIFDLSYGENSMTLAVAYDWLFDALSDAEKREFRTIAKKRSFDSFLVHTRKGKGKSMWWFGAPHSNWNTVCAGGGGMLALAMHDDLPEAKEVLRRAEQSFVPYMKSLNESGGAWPEGIGYWNYGMMYAFLYLLSHENATGRKHPLLRQKSTAKTLWFPLEFCPNGVPCSFGDVNHWSPMPFHYAMAERLKIKGLVPALDACLPTHPPKRFSRPGPADLIMLHPRTNEKPLPAAKSPVVRLYKGQDWAALADRMPNPDIYVSIRGGTTEVPHNHLDLMSFHCVVGDEAMITNVGVSEYLDTTFSPRRFEMFEPGFFSKNTILINGIGITRPSRVHTSVIPDGIRIDATDAMRGTRDDKAAMFCGRAFLLLKGKAVLVIDRIELKHLGRVESRAHSFAEATFRKSHVSLNGKRQRARVSYACDVDATLRQALTAPTSPGPSANVLRWCTDKLNTHVTMATLITPGASPASIAISSEQGNLLFDVEGKGLKTRVKLTRRLRPLKG